MSTSPCKGGFDSNYPCVCDKVPCPPGTARNISYGSLSDSECQKRISIDYTCTNISSTVKTDTTTPSNTTPAQDQGTSGAVEKPKGLSFLALLVLILPISLVVYVWYIKNQNEIYFHHLLEAVLQVIYANSWPWKHKIAETIRSSFHLSYKNHLKTHTPKVFRKCAV